MGTTDFADLANPLRTTARILWLSFLTSPALYLVAVWVVATQGPPSDARLPPAVLPVLYGVAAASAVGAWKLSRRFRSAAAIQARLDRPFDAERFATHPKTGRLDPALLEKVRRLSETDQVALGLLAWWQSRQILVWALAEAPSVIGLALGMIGRELEPMIPLLATSFVVLLATRPRLADLRNGIGPRYALVATRLG